jgi:TP901 family phage tail tape measure protein
MSTGALDLGTLYSKLFVDYSDLAKAEKEAIAFTSKTNAHIGKLSDGFKNTGKVLTATVTTSLSAVAALSFNAARNFSVAFADVQKQVSDLNDTNIGDFEKKILNIGRNSLIGAEGVAALVSEGGKLGEQSKGALEFAEAAEKMAVAFDFERNVNGAKQAGEIIGKLRSLFDLTTKEVLEMGDAVNYFADNTSGSVQGILNIVTKQGATIKQATSLTNSQIVGLATTFEQLSENSDIGATSMKNFVIALTKGQATADKQSETFKQIGLDAVEMSKVMKTDAVKGINMVLEAIGKAKDYEKTGIISTLFGQESIGPIMAVIGRIELLNENLKLAADNSKFLDSLTKEWKRAMNTDDNKMQLALSALNVAFINIGKVIVPVIADLATKFSQWMTSIGNLDPGLVKLGLVMGAAAAAMGPLLFGIGSFLGAVLPAITAAGGLSAALAGLAAIAGPIGAVIAGLAEGAYLLYTNWETVSTFFSEIIDSVIGYFNNWKDENSNLLAGISSSWNDFVAVASELWTTLYTIVSEAVISTISSLNSMLEPIGGLQGAWKILKESIETYISVILTVVKTWLDVMSVGMNELSKALKTDDWSYFKDLAVNAFNIVITNLEIFGLKVLKELLKIPTYFKEIFNGIVKYIHDIQWIELGKSIIEGIYNGIVMSKDNLFKAIENTIKGISSEVKPTKELYETGKDMMQGIQQGIKDNSIQGSIDKEIKDLESQLGGSLDKIKADFAKQQAELKQETEALSNFEGVTDAMVLPDKGAIEIAQKTSEVIDLTNQELKNKAPELKQAGLAMTEGVSSGITDGAPKAKEVAEQFSNEMRDAMNDFKNLESSIMQDTRLGDGYNYEKEIANEQAQYDKSLAMLKEAQDLKIESILGYEKLREQIEAKHADNLMSINRAVFSDTRSALDQTLSSLEQYGGKQTKIYKAIFAASKAFAIAEAMLSIQQNIANAMKVGFPYNIPFIAGAVAQGAGIVANIQSIGAFNNGGYLGTGQVGMVGEKGAELITGPANVLSTQNTKEFFNSGGDKAQAPTIIIQNLPGQTATVSTDRDNATIIRIAVDTAKKEITHEANNGGGYVVPAILKASGQRRRA